MAADNFYTTSEPDVFKNLKGHFDLLINTIPVEINVNRYLKLLTVDGVMVVVALPEKELSIGAFSLVSSLVGSAIGGIRETQEMLDFCSKDDITSDIEVIPIQKVNEAYERVLKSDVRYRFVIDIANSLKCND